MATPLLPTLFGRFTAVSSDHVHLGATLHRLRDMCSALEPENVASSTELELVPLVADLLLELSQHFAAEEADGYFGAVVQDQPGLLPHIQQLKAEHVTMLEAIGELVRMAAVKERRVELGAATSRLLTQYRKHEHRETELLQEFLLRDHGAGGG